MKPKNNEVRYVQIMGNPSHTYGNALAFIEKWVLDLFPKRSNNESIFRSINVSSKIAHQQLKTTSAEIYKRIKPAIVFRPRVDFSEEKFLNGTPLVDKMTQGNLNYGLPGLQSFFKDTRTNTTILYQLNRTVMYVDVIMIFSTLLQQLNYATFIKNSISLGHPFNLQTCLESFLAPELIEMVSEICGVPVFDDNKSVYKFLQFMNQNSVYPITYKLQGSTNSNEFFRYHPVTIDTKIDSIDLTDGERNGQVSENYQINMSIRMEFYTTGFYYLLSNNVFKVKHPIYENNSAIIPIYTDVLLKEDLNLQPGWQMINRASTILEKDYDKVNIKSLIRPSVNEAVKYYLSHNLSLYDLIDIKVRKQGILLSQGIDYLVNYDTWDVEFNNLEYGFYTYTIMICVNIEGVNDLVKKVYNLK